MLGAIAAEAPGDVIVLSPLPCADTLYMRYRDRVAEILRRLSDNHGFLFLRSPLGSGNHEQYFVDPTHLNALGHDVVGQAVAEAISNVCRGVTDNLAFQS
jgi:lysophospholipase L1-like esterase